MNEKYFVFLAFDLFFFQLTIAEEFNQTGLNYIDLQAVPPVLYHEDIYLSILYQCSSIRKRRISLSIHVDQPFYGKNISIFYRYWYCQATSYVQTIDVRVRLPKELAYASNIQSNFHSWPIEDGQLKIIMFDGKKHDENQILQEVQYHVRFLPVDQRPNFRSIRWNPSIYTKNEASCPVEPEILRLVNYPMALTSSVYGKYASFPSFSDFNLLWEKQVHLTRAKFSILLWIYIDEYCPQSSSNLCAIFQHLTFNMTKLSPEIFLNRQGQVVVHMYEYLYDLKGDNARTLDSIPKKDWCRILLVVKDNSWSIFVNCLKTWKKTIRATYRAPITYYYNDQLGSFIVGGSQKTPSFRGFIGQLDVYRRVALKPGQLPKNLHLFHPSFLPTILSESTECLPHLSSFHQSRKQVDLFHQHLQQKNICSAFPVRLTQPNQQCLLIRTWKEQSNDIPYRIFRALYRGVINSTNDVGEKLSALIINRLENKDSEIACQHVLNWLEHAVCYKHPASHSLLATFYQFGLCGLQSNLTRVMELLFNGALLTDRMSLLALGHRHFYGLDGVPRDFDAACAYYRQMANIFQSEFYNPVAGEVVMEYIRLTDDKLIEELILEKSDSFYWLKEQARRGVVSAQQRLASLMYEGANGLARNMPAAMQYFRQAANQNHAPADYVYGLSLLTGQGVPQNVSEGIRYLEKAVKHGNNDARIALGHYAYSTEKNYTKAAKYWQDCYDINKNMYCAHNLGVMWTQGHYPPDYRIDYDKAWQYYAYAAQKGQIDSRIVVAYYNALADHPWVLRDPGLSATWSRMVAIESTALGLTVRRALTAYLERRWDASLLFYLQAALSGSELGYYNGGYLCHELKINYKTAMDCIEQLLEMSLMMRRHNLQQASYDLLVLAEYYHLKKNDSNQTIELYGRLFRSGDPRGLFHLVQMEEMNVTIPLNIWQNIGVQFEEKFVTDKYRRIQTIYQYCRSLTIPRADESYIPCTISYLRVSTRIFLDEYFKIVITIILLILVIYLWSLL